MAKYQSYVICTSPRSGSTLLCQLLAATGEAGNPNSHFHDPSISEWLKDYELVSNEYATKNDVLKAIFDVAHKRGTGSSKIFGLRLQRRSFDFFMQQVDILHAGFSSDLARIQAAFGNTLFIHLTRANKLEQSISFVKAEQTGLWHRAQDGTELERLSAPQEPIYDADQISRELSTLKAYDKEWETWFERENIVPLRITYDELSVDPTKVLTHIVQKLGLDPTVAQGISPQVAKLSDATNRIWAERFLAENRAQIKSKT